MRQIRGILLIFSLGVISANADIDWNKAICGFSDVNWDNKYCMEIHKGKIEKVITGYNELGNPLKPKNPITRAELTTVVVRSHHEKIKKCELGKPFNDVLSKEWYCKYINTAKDLQWVKGVQGGSSYFKPNEPINLVQALKIMILGYRMKDRGDNKVHYINNDKAQVTYIFNENLGNWFDTYVNWAKEQHLSLFDKNNVDLSKPILREEVLNMYKEVDDVFSCHTPEGVAKVITQQNPQFYQSKKPTCYEKALYYSYLKFGSKILRQESSLIKGNMKQVEQVQLIFDMLFQVLKKGLDTGISQISISDSCSDKRDYFDKWLRNAKAIDNQKILEGVPEDIIKMVNDGYMYYCQIQKFKNVSVYVRSDIQMQLIIQGLFDSFKIINNLIAMSHLDDETTKMMSINVAYAFLGEYYSFGGNMKELAKKYGTTANIDDLIKAIAKKESYTLPEDISHRWIFSEVTFNLELTKSYIKSVMDVVQKNYKGVM